MTKINNTVSIPEGISIYSALGMLMSTTKIKEKTNIIKALRNNNVFCEILRFTYDSNINFYITSIEPKKIGSLDLQSDWNFIRIMLIQLSERKITGNNARQQITALMENYNEHSQVIVNEILQRDLRCNIGSTLINKALGIELIKEFKVQLCNPYDETKKYKTAKWFATPKLDGIRGFWKNSTPDVIYSRNGKPHIGLDHIIKDIKTLEQKVPQLAFLDGELFITGDNFNNIQGNIMSKVNYTEEDKEKVKFNIFAVGNENGWKNTNEMNDYIASLYSLVLKIKLEDKLCNSLNFIPAIQIDNTKEDVYKTASYFTSLGYEGVVLRDPLEAYNFKRSNSLVKFKFFNEVDLTIIDTVEGTGKYEGSLGTIVAAGACEDNNISTEIGTGYNDDLRKTLWERRESIVGKTVTVKYQGISMNSNGGYSLRFPVYIGIKEDR